MSGKDEGRRMKDEVGEKRNSECLAKAAKGAKVTEGQLLAEQSCGVVLCSGLTGVEYVGRHPRRVHQRQLDPAANKFHKGNGSDGKHYWLIPPDLYAKLNAEFNFDFDPCPYPKPETFDGLTAPWGKRNWVNPPFGSIIHNGKKKGPTAWMRKAIEERNKGNLSVVVYPVDKWILLMLAACGVTEVRNLGDVRWCAIEDGSAGKGTGRHIAAFILRPQSEFLRGSKPSDIFEQVQREIQIEESKPKANGGILFPSHDLAPSFGL